MPYSYDRIAASKLNPATLRSIARMTDNNQHGKALVTGAKMLGFEELSKKFTLISELQEMEGHLPTGLREYQYSLYQALMDAAKGVLSAEEYEQFNKVY